MDDETKKAIEASIKMQADREGGQVPGVSNEEYEMAKALEESMKTQVSSPYGEFYEPLNPEQQIR